MIAAADPSREFRQSFASWAPMTAGEIRRWEVIPAIHERINARGLMEINSTPAPVGGYIVRRRENWGRGPVTMYAAGPPEDERGLMKWLDDVKRAKVYPTIDQARAVAKVYRGKVVRYADAMSGQTILADGAPAM